VGLELLSVITLTSRYAQLKPTWMILAWFVWVGEDLAATFVHTLLCHDAVQLCRSEIGWKEKSFNATRCETLRQRRWQKKLKSWHCLFEEDA
jgi:hypothetical protein